MILVGFTFGQVVLNTLWVSLIVLILVLIYRKVIKTWSKDEVSKKDFFVLYGLDEDPAKGEIPFYFTAEFEREYKLSLLNSNMEFVQEIASGLSKNGGNIIRFDSTQIEDGKYFYSLESNNQKISKMMKVSNND